VRVLLFLLLATAAAAQPIQCVYEDYTPVSADIQYDSPFELVRVARPKVQGMRRTRIDDITVYTRTSRTEMDFRVFVLFAERGGEWFELQANATGLVIQDRGVVRPETEKPPIITRAKAGLPIVRATWISQWMGANRAGLTRMTVLLDFRAKPRVLLSIDCSDAWGGGACSAPALAPWPKTELRCDDDLRCTMHEYVNVDWTTRAATRRFDLLTNATLPPSRFDAVRYATAAAFAAAAPDSIRQRALIDGIGLVYPVYEVSPGTVIFAAHRKDPVAGFRFFLLREKTWSEIPVTLLTDAVYPGENQERAGSIARDFTPDYPQPIFTAWDLELPGKRKLIEVLGVEGTSSTLHWIMLGPAGRTGALRVTTSHPEWRECDNVVYPISASSLGIPDSGLPARVDAVASWRHWDLRDGLMPRTCDLVGTIDWSTTRGWIVRLGQAPCTDPILRPLKVTISDTGELRAEQVSLSQ